MVLADPPLKLLSTNSILILLFCPKVSFRILVTLFVSLPFIKFNTLSMHGLFISTVISGNSTTCSSGSGSGSSIIGGGHFGKYCRPPVNGGNED